MQYHKYRKKGEMRPFLWVFMQKNYRKQLILYKDML